MKDFDEFGVSCFDCVQCTDWVCHLMHFKHVPPGEEVHLEQENLGQE